MITTKTKIVTHNGRFHADDIFAVATLLILHPEAEVVRSRDKEVVDSADIVVDVGLVYDPESKKFDHHQEGGAGERENGIPYASFGLVWKKWGESIAGQEEAELIDNRLVASVDAHDNGVEIADYKFPLIRDYAVFDFFSSYIDYSEDDETVLLEIFMKCVGIAKELLEREIAIAKSHTSGLKKVQTILENTEDKRIVLLEESLPWSSVLVPAETLYVIYPRKEGKWGVKAVPRKLLGYETKKPFPKSWGGKVDEELAKITGVKDSVFCHNKLFVCSARSREGAIKLAEIALNA